MFAFPLAALTPVVTTVPCWMTPTAAVATTAVVMLRFLVPAAQTMRKMLPIVPVPVIYTLSSTPCTLLLHVKVLCFWMLRSRIARSVITLQWHMLN